MTTLGRAGKAAIAVMSILLALLIVSDGVAATAENISHPPVAASEAPVVTLSPSSSGERHHDDPGTEDCQTFRHAPAPVTAPVPTGKSGCACGCDTATTEPGSVAFIPLTGRHQAVPVSRSGELPVLLQVFRS